MDLFIKFPSFLSEGLQSPAADIILSAISRHLGSVTVSQSNMSQLPTSTSLPPVKKRRLSEPSQAQLQNNLVTSQNLFANNLYPLLRPQKSAPSHLTSPNQSTPSTALSFTPLMFRQFPRIGDLPTQSSLFTAPSFKPSSAFASQLFQLANQHPSTAASGLKMTNGDHDGFHGPLQTDTTKSSPTSKSQRNGQTVANVYSNNLYVQ